MATVNQLRAMSQPSGGAPSTSAVRWNTFPNFTGAWTSSESIARWAAGISCTVKNPTMSLQTAPGAGKSWSFQIRKNGADVTGAVISIADTAQSGTYLGSIVVAPGDEFTIQSTPSGTPTATGITTLTWEQESATSGESQHTGYVNAPSTTLLRYKGPLSEASGGWETTAPPATNVISLAGSFTKLIAVLAAAPGAGTSYVFTFYKNGVKQDGGGGTVNTTLTVSDAEITDSVTFDLPVVPGDEVYIECSPVSTPTSRTMLLTNYFVATDGKSFMMAFCDQGAQATFPRYHNGMTSSVNDGSGGWGSATQTAGLAHLCPVTGYTLGKMYAKVTAAPGAGTSRTLALHRDGSAPTGAPTITIADANTTGNDLTGTMTLAAGQFFGINGARSGAAASSRTSVSIAANAYSGPLGSCVMNGFATTDDHMAARGDMMSAMRQYLQCLYCTSNPDIAPLTERYRKDRTATDSSDVWNALRDASYGLETS